MALFRFFYPRTSFYTLSSKERLLQNPHSEKEEKQYEEYEAVKPRPSDSLTIKTLLVITLFLLTSNTYLLIYRQNSLIKDDHLLRFSKFAKLAYDTPITYHTHTDYQSKNQTLQNEMWDSIDTSPLVVTLTDEYATSHDIPLSKFRFPWDAENKGVYYLKTYHHLHCLKAIRKSLLNHEHGLPQYSTGKYTHLLHCLDALRQDMTCNADDTPMPMTSLRHSVIGDGQTRMCRSLDKLIAWGKESERHACYHRWSDYRGRVENVIEMYAFCEEGSENERVAKAYFEKWGHKSPYEDGMLLGKDDYNY